MNRLAVGNESETARLRCGRSTSLDQEGHRTTRRTRHVRVVGGDSEDPGGDLHCGLSDDSRVRGAVVAERRH